MPDDDPEYVDHGVAWGEDVSHKATDLFGPRRSPLGGPNRYDFASGPLAAAAERFRDFESLPEEVGPDVRSVHVTDPVFGHTVFVGVRVRAGTVEIADFASDLDDWDAVADVELAD